MRKYIYVKVVVMILQVFLSSEILLRKIKSQKLGDNGEMIIAIDLILI